MKALVFNMLTIAATFAAMTACTSESDPVDEVTNQPTPVLFGSSISEITSKAVAENATAFGAGEDIGVTMYTVKTQAEPTGTALGSPNKSNITFTSDASGKFTEKGGSTMFWERGAYHYFYAYYPVTTASNENYKYTAATGSTSEQITVKVQADGTTTDLLMAQNTTGTEFNGIASETNLSFSHMMSKIKFVFKKDASYTKAGVLTEINVKVNNESITFNLVNPGSGTASSTTGVTLAKTGLTYTIGENATGSDILDWAPIVVPGSSVSNLTLKIDEETLSATTINNLTLKAGFVTKIIITLKSSGTEFTSDINAWQDDNNSGDAEVQ